MQRIAAVAQQLQHRPLLKAAPAAASTISSAVGRMLLSSTAPSSASASTASDSVSGSGDVVVDIKSSGAAWVTLNRPKALNALNMSMVTKLIDALPSLDHDNRCRVIILQGAGHRAFCAGGDILSVSGDDLEDSVSFFATEFSVCYLAASLRKPLVALYNGVVMGGGVGISVHSRYRVASPTVKFAMPESNIGFFPDIGISYFFNRQLRQWPGLALYLGLTGNHLNAGDLIQLEFATHSVTNEGLSRLVDELSQTQELLAATDIDRAVEAILNRHHSITEVPKPLICESGHKLIADVFRTTPNEKIGDVMARLSKRAAEGHEFAVNTLKTIEARCPLSCAVWFEQLKRRPASLSLLDTLNLDFRLATAFVAREPNCNFKEGVRALLRDKTKDPKWNPSRIADVDEAYVDRLFDPEGVPHISDLVALPKGY